MSNKFSNKSQTNLTVDWDGSAVNYTCFSWKYPLPVNEDVESIITCDTIPENYSVKSLIFFNYIIIIHNIIIFISFSAASSLLHG